MAANLLDIRFVPTFSRGHFKYQEESLKPSEVLRKCHRRLECHNLKNDFKLIQHTLHTYLPYFNYICKSHSPRAFLSFSSFALVCGPFTSCMHFKVSTFDVAWISLGLFWAKSSKFMCKIAPIQHQIPCPSANLPGSFANLWQISSGFVALHRWDETCCDSLPPCWWWPQDGFMMFHVSQPSNQVTLVPTSFLMNWSRLLRLMSPVLRWLDAHKKNVRNTWVS